MGEEDSSVYHVKSVEASLPPIWEPHVYILIVCLEYKVSSVVITERDLHEGEIEINNIFN